MFQRVSKPLMLEDITQVELDLGILIPNEVKIHYLQHNGGLPDPNTWIIDEDFGIWHSVSTFFPMRYPSDFSTGITIESVYKQGQEKDFLLRDLVPFANDPGGNFFCFDPNGQVYFYSMDDWDQNLSKDENKLKSKRFLTNSFSAFVEGLTSEPKI